MVAFRDFFVLYFIVKGARWAGGPNQEELRKKYFLNRMCEAVARLKEESFLSIVVLY